jgi:hypothetical protein
MNDIYGFRTKEIFAYTETIFFREEIILIKENAYEQILW